MAEFLTESTEHIGRGDVAQRLRNASRFGGEPPTFSIGIGKCIASLKPALASLVHDRFRDLSEYSHFG